MKESVSVYAFSWLPYGYSFPNWWCSSALFDDMVLSPDNKTLTHQTAVQAQRVGSLNQARCSKVNQATVNTALSKGTSTAMLVAGCQCSPVALPTEVWLIKFTESNWRQVRLELQVFPWFQCPGFTGELYLVWRFAIGLLVLGLSLAFSPQLSLPDFLQFLRRFPGLCPYSEWKGFLFCLFVLRCWEWGPVPWAYSKL